jgi:Mn-dependent DtxR family transcriptional regulator
VLVGFGRTEHQKLDRFSVLSDPPDLMHKNQEQLAWRLLETLYELGRADVAATPEVLTTWLDLPEPRVQELLGRLDMQGLVDASRCRLSMRGLVLAVSMHGAQKLSRQSAAA